MLRFLNAPEVLKISLIWVYSELIREFRNKTHVNRGFKFFKYPNKYPKYFSLRPF